MVIVAGVTAVVAGFAPIVSTSSCEASPVGSMRCASGTTSLVGNEGLGVLLVLAGPVVVALLPVLFRSPRWTTVTAVLLSGAALFGAASVGMLLLPIVVLAWVAAARSHRSAATA